MSESNKRSIVLKIGGSLLYKEGLNLEFAFITKLKAWYVRNRDQFDKIVMVVGGGKLSRFIGNEVDPYVDDKAEHVVAMQTTILNAEIVRILLDDAEVQTPRTLGEGFEKLFDPTVKKIVMGGLKEGWSTDMDAAVAADFLGVKRIYKLSNIDHVYTADPKTDNNAQPIKEILWKDYFTMFDIVVGDTSLSPNNHSPIDSTCAQFCFNKGLSFFVSGGKYLANVDDIGSIFESGTLIH